MASGVGGQSSTARLIPRAGNWSSEKFTTVSNVDDSGCTQTLSYVFDTVDLSWSSESLSGTLKGSLNCIGSGVASTIFISGKATGLPDRVPPTAVVAQAMPHPMDGATVLFSEALPQDARVSVVPADGVEIDLNQGGPPIRATFSAFTPLEQATLYKVVVKPSLRDLAGNDGIASMLPTLTTLAIPLIPVDGFEGGTLPYLTGAAMLATAATAPPIAGARSLLFPPSNGTLARPRFTARLALPRGAHSPRATARPIAAHPGLRRHAVRITVRPNATFGRSYFPDEAVFPPTCATATPTSWCYGDPIQLEYNWTLDSSDEVTVDMIHTGSAAPGLLIDDLRVE